MGKVHIKIGNRPAKAAGKGVNMLEVSVPGRGDYILRNLILDMNGTIALDGTLIPGVAPRIGQLKEILQVYLITADTFGSAVNTAAELGIQLVVVDPLAGDRDKLEFIRELGSPETIAIGNGFNDVGLLGEAGISMVVIGPEGCSVKALQAAQIAVTDIRDALDMLIHTKRLVATLRA